MLRGGMGYAAPVHCNHGTRRFRCYHLSVVKDLTFRSPYDIVTLQAVEGISLIRMAEITFLEKCISAGASASDAKKVYGALWLLAVDAKTRKRRPDGSIVTAAELELEAAATEAAMKARADTWATRLAAMDGARMKEHGEWKEGDPPTNPLEHMVQERWKTSAAGGARADGAGDKE